MYNVFVVEDDFELLDNIQIILDHLGHSVVGFADNGEEALELILNSRPDVILMDIMLAGNLNGINLALKIRDFMNVPIIFLTAFSDTDYLDEISVISEASFLLKPFMQESLNSAVYLAMKKQNKKIKTNKFLNIKDKGLTVPLKESEILMLKADGLYTRIFTNDRQYLVRDILKDIQINLSQDIFIRIHKSYLVNIDYVTAFNSKKVNVLNFVVPIRRGFSKDFSELLNNRLIEIN